MKTAHGVPAATYASATGTRGGLAASQNANPYHGWGNTVTTAGVARLNAEAMEGCRIAVSAQAGHLGGVGDRIGGADLPAGALGGLDAAGALSGAVSQFRQKLTQDFHAAEQLLIGVERALDAVQTSVAEVEAANTAGLSAST